MQLCIEGYVGTNPPSTCLRDLLMCSTEGGSRALKYMNARLLQFIEDNEPAILLNILMKGRTLVVEGP